jgi:hypothetical protein
MLTGKIHNKPTSKEYEENWDKIFKKKEEEKPEEKKQEEALDVVSNLINK